RAILETRGPFTVATGHGDMHMGEARTSGSIETGLAMVGCRTGCDTVIAPDTFRLVDQQDIGPFHHAMAAEVGHTVALFRRFDDDDCFQIALLYLALHIFPQVRMTA